MPRSDAITPTQLTELAKRLEQESNAYNSDGIPSEWCADLRAAARCVAALAKLERMRTGKSDRWYCFIDKFRRPTLAAAFPGQYATAIEAIEGAEGV